MSTHGVNISEVCPRDGFQSLPLNIPTEDKIHIINKLADCNYKEIEVTSFVHPKAIPQLRDAFEVSKGIMKNSQTVFRALIPNLKGLERAIAADIKKVKLMLSATDSHSISNANSTTKEALNEFKRLVKLAKESDITITGSIAVAFGCPYEGNVTHDRLLWICEKYSELEIDTISLADTAGMGNPYQTKKMIKTLRNHYPEMKFSLHLHNTRGMAFANAIAGYEEGIQDFDSSVAGLGGCPYSPNASGNIASEDLIHGFEEMGIKTGIDLDKVLEVAKLIHEKYPDHTDSFLLKAGKNSDLYMAPAKQIKLN